jgi:cytochrome c peroxidase
LKPQRDWLYRSGIGAEPDHRVLSPGSVRTRFSDRKPQSHAYVPLSPVLHYNPGQGDLVGGNFWDMRATGRRLGNPAAEQAQGPPT